MSIYINSVNIKTFRGINQLVVDNLNHINLIVGDNNSGKTSILEALLLMRKPEEISNLLRIARLRDSAAFSSGTSIYENFMNLFSKAHPFPELAASFNCKGNNIEVRVFGEEKSIFLEPQDIPQRFSVASYQKQETDYLTKSEVLAFYGKLECAAGDYYNAVPIEMNEYSRISGMEIKRSDALKMQYLSPVDHLKGNIVDRIIRNDDYKEVCLRIIQVFDPDITDILILRNEITGRPIEYIKHKQLGNMPISTYGDGIKKVLALANAIARAAGGILLIDEIETAIHARYYDDIFRFVTKACKQFDVQVFITTHNIEAVDGILATQDYSLQDTLDDISVVTIKRTPEKSFARVLAGREVFVDRDAFGFEVRL